MSESVVFNLNSPHLNSSDERKTSTIEEKERTPIHLFLSPSHSGSAYSFSSHSSGTGEKTVKKLTQKISREPIKAASKERKTEVSSFSDKEYAESVLSSSGCSQDYSSSDLEDYCLTQSKTKKSFHFPLKSKSNIRTNKIHDSEVLEKNKKINPNDGESENCLQLIQLKKNNDDKGPFISESFIDSEVKVKTTTLSEMSYRDRIRDRFKIMKEQAVESLSRPQSRSHSKLKLLALKQGGTQMEDLLKQEENEVLAAMKRHEKMKLHWGEISKVSLKNGLKTPEECNYFFTETQGQISLKLTPVTEELKSLSKADSLSETQEDSKILISELLGMKEDWELTEFAKPELKNITSEKLWEEKLFYASTKSVSLENKMKPGLTLRYLEKEGISVRSKIKLPKQIINKMEQRILMTPDDEGRKWFGKDGLLISSTCLLKPVSIRPYYDESGGHTSMQIAFKQAALGHLNCGYLDFSENLNYVLDIDISSIEFTHHPLFSREHVLAQRLLELYVKYKKRKETDDLNRLTGRMNALRRTRDNLKKIVNESGDNKNLKEKLQKYEDDIKEIRQERYLQGQIDKQLNYKILNTWKDLQKLREQQGYQNTPIKLSIKKKVPSDLKEEKYKWDSSVKEETKEIFEELRKNYETALEEYRENFEIWNQRNQKKFQAEETEDFVERLSYTESAIESGSEREDFFKEEPKPPKSIVVGDVKAQVIENFKTSFRQPGEPEIEFSMSKAANLDVFAYNNKEELRRGAVKRCMIFIKLFYNGKEVCRSKSQPLSQNFNVTIGQRFAIRILEWPESLMIEIHEETGTLNRNLLVPGIYLPFPDSFTTIQNSEFEKQEFSSKISISYHHAAVGSGNKVIPCPDGTDLNNQPLCLYTSGTVACRVGWMDDNGKILALPEKIWINKKEEPNRSLAEILRSGGTFDVKKLKKWVENSKLDPNNPYNSTFFHFLENVGDSEKTQSSYFRLNPLFDEFDFCKKNEIQANVRLKLLKLRDIGELEFRAMKMIPLNEKQIHKQIFQDYEKKISSTYFLTGVLTSDPLDGHRAWGKKYLEQVQQKLLKQRQLSKPNKRFQDIVTEESVPDIGTLGLTLMKWLRPKRPLRPIRKERKKITPQNLSGQEINIIVNVVRAFEVPVRKDADSMSTIENNEGFPLVNVRPFVEISFRGITARTTAAEGANPTWNQDLKIPVTSKNEFYSTENFQSIQDTLYIHLFDEMVIDLIEDETTRETNIHQRLERHWLASMKIPFSTLYLNSRIEGTFKLYSPPVLLGYEREAHRRHFSGSTGQESLPQRDATYITLFATLQPALNPPKLIKEKMESGEMMNLERHLIGWQQEVTNMFPHRKVKTLALDITGKSVCVTRFVKPLSLPPIAEGDKSTPEMAARFVSMIPSIPESAIFSEYFDIWLTSDQFLRLLRGHSEDHAVLLCSYFLKLGLNAYVLLGSGNPHGSTAYVLVKEQIERSSIYYIWDSTSGQKYNIEDSFCPLQKVYCLINDQNIWANIQAEEIPRRTRFNLTRRTDWFPAFGKNISAPSESVQPQSLQYKMTSRQAVDALQDRIEKKLKDNIMKWRKKNRTQWNRYCAATLRKLLSKLEKSTWNLGKDYSPNHILELQHILASHRMCGFPINMAYTGIEATIEAVKATGVHCNDTEGIEFALAVYIHPYPNDVLSVWVYVASLVRRR